MKPINIYQPELGTEELNAIKQVFDSNWLGYGRQGTRQAEFVKSFANKIITKSTFIINVRKFKGGLRNMTKIIYLYPGK